MKIKQYVHIIALSFFVMTQSACAHAQTQVDKQTIVTQSIQLEDGEHYIIERIVRHNKSDIMIQLKGLNNGLYAYHKPEIKISLKETQKVTSFLNQYPELTLLAQQGRDIVVSVPPESLARLWKELSQRAVVLKQELLVYKPKMRLR